MLRYTVLSIAVLVSVVGLNCKNGDSTQKSELIGTWDVYLTELNGRPNDLMQKAWFSFRDDNLADSNLFGENNAAGYSVEKGRLIIKAAEPLDLRISKLQGDTMVLEGKVKFYHMVYHMVRRK